LTDGCGFQGERQSMINVAGDARHPERVSRIQSIAQQCDQVICGRFLYHDSQSSYRGRLCRGATMNATCNENGNPHVRSKSEQPKKEEVSHDEG
jgi:hypothetical protein